MLESVICNLCGANHYEALYKKPKAQAGEDILQDYLITQDKIVFPERIVKCLKCGLTYVNPRRAKEEILDKYNNMVDEGYIKEETGRRLTAKLILDKLGKYKKGGAKLLEIGCGPGFLLDEAKKQGWDAYGVEPSRWASDHARNKFNLKVTSGILRDTDFSSGYFDVVILSDTLEHLIDPKGILSEVRPLLGPQGILYINTPNVDSLISRLLKARWWGFNQFHLYYFTKDTLRQMLEVVGFDVVRWGSYCRTFTFDYWLKKLEGHDSKLFGLLKFIFGAKALRHRLISLHAGDQMEVIAKRQRKIIYLSELERDKDTKERKQKMKVTVVLPAYNAANTLQQTIKDIPKDIVDEIILVDDASSDNTVEVAKKLGLVVFQHENNKGYGANQKTCYIKALERGADIVVMVHPDYQYDPTAIPQMVAPIQKGEADAVFGSRMLKGGALEGGMPIWKHNANIVMTAFANVTLGTYLTEYHSGFRAYSANLLRSIKFEDNSDSFVFDTEIIVQILLHYFKIGEVPIRTRYFQEASVITLFSGFRYGMGILITLFKYLLHKYTFVKFSQFQ
ncbi:methyltransferase domain-containing protein [Candidatus Omnitrophota bacterium]